VTGLVGVELLREARDEGEDDWGRAHERNAGLSG
jgi:hypothetical protein